MTTSHPMVSCLMVTRGRAELVSQAIACYGWQSYRSRELVVVAEPDGVAAVEAAAAVAGVAGVRVVAASRPAMPLGELRNTALDAARGELVAQWDDDDLYHPCRVAAQVAAMRAGAVASFLTSQLQYFATRRELFVTDWRRRGRPTLLEPVPDCIPGTAVFRRSLGLRYPHIRVKDDVVMLEQLELRGEVARISDAPHLYLYRHHGANTFAEDHWRWITRWSVSARELRRLRIPITISLQHFAPFIGSAPVRVRSRSGATAYRLTPAPRPLPAPAAATAAAAPAETAPPASAPSLRLSVAIATWNRADLLRETLLSLAAAAVPRGVEVEVLVCDNRSTDNTADVVAAAAAGLPLRGLCEEKEGKSWALRRLLGEAAGEWVLFLDDDVLADPGLIAAYADGIRRHPRAGCLGGQVLPWLDEPARGLRAALLVRYPWMHSVVAFDRDETISPAELRFVHGPNLAVRRDAVVADDVDTRRGMFGRTRISGEDLALVERVMARGHEGWRLAGAVVHHFVPRARSGFAWFLHRHLGEARSRAVEAGRVPGSLRYRLGLLAALAPALVGPALRRYDRLQWAIRWRARRVASAVRRRLRRTSS